MAAQPRHDRLIRQLAFGRVAASGERGNPLPAHPFHQCLSEAGLADARFPGDQHQARAAGCFAPGFLEQRPLSLAAHQRRSGLELRQRGGLALHIEQPLIDLARWPARLHVQLAAQDGNAGMVRVEGSGAVVVQRVKAHQLGVDRFVERIVPQQRLRVADGLPVVTALLVQGSQLFQRLAIHLRQPVALGQQPIAVAAGQQLATIQRHSLLPAAQLIVSVCG